MMNNIGAQYEQTKAWLQRGIRSGSVDTAIAEPGEHACYFCLRHIDGRAHVIIRQVTIRGEPAEKRYFLDDRCFEQAKVYEGQLCVN